MQEHGWAWSDIQNMMPFELDIFLILLRKHLAEKKDRAKLDK